MNHSIRNFIATRTKALISKIVGDAKLEIVLGALLCEMRDITKENS